jgi:MFS family permease
MRRSKQPQAAFTGSEGRAAAGLAGIYALRMLGLFVILPVFAVQAQSLAGATPLLIGLAIGAYGLTQAMLQIPFGLLSDRIGRKPIIFAGLVLFAVGSVVAAMSGSIHGVILGRVLQGSGAIAAAVMALTADLTREEVRTRAMAGIGVSIGLSFALALVLGPALTHWIGLSGIFWFTALLALGGILILALVVPNPDHTGVHRDAEPVIGQLGGVLRNPELLRLDFGIFCLHLSMTSLFLVVPLALRDHGLPVGHHWWIYLPVLALSIGLMVPGRIAGADASRLPRGRYDLGGGNDGAALFRRRHGYSGRGPLAGALLHCRQSAGGVLAVADLQAGAGGGQGHGHGGLFHLPVHRGLLRRGARRMGT